MKRFIAFSGGSNSGITTKEKAREWATQWLTKNVTTVVVHITEVIETADRDTPPITFNQFFVDLDEPVNKTVKAA